MQETRPRDSGRRNHGWLYILDDDLRCIARPEEVAPLPTDAEAMVQRAAAAWATSTGQPEVLMLLTPSLAARVFPMHGPAGSCTVVYLEPMLVRADS